VGAALAAWHIWKNKEHDPDSAHDRMHGALLGPEYGTPEIVRVARKYEAPYRQYDDYNFLCKETARLLSEGKVVGWFQGRMEYGPRALGNRSILGDPRDPDMQKRLNLKIKYREGFRPFAPSVLEEECRDFFELDRPSPYMLLVAFVKAKRCIELPENYLELPLRERLYHRRSDIPAVTHVDFSARIHTVSREINEGYWKLLQAFKEQTGCPLLVNTSFNVRGEPIVCSPEDAYRCFMRTEMDYLVMGDFLFDKRLQPPWKESREWEHDYVLD